MTTGEGSGRSQLTALLGYLEHDPGNLALLADTANAAFEASALDDAEILLARHKAVAPLPQSLVNLEGLIALRQGKPDLAAIAFDSLIAQGVSDPSVRFNRAWIHAVKAEHAEALALLDDDVVAVTSRAPALRVQMLHHLGRIDDALADGASMTTRFPGNDALLGALSVAAMDNDDFDLALHYADAATGGADALTTRGLAALNENETATALAFFDAALTEVPHAPRALLGRGLGLIATGQMAEGAAALTRGAEIFGNHLGSWIAVGWTQFIAKNLTAARDTFERALALDENFAETHGALAVLDISEGKLDAGKRRADIAMRLDRQCFGGMLALVLLEEAKGNAAGVQRILDRALTAPVGVNGKTLAQAMLGMGFAPGTSRAGGT